VFLNQLPIEQNQDENILTEIVHPENNAPNQQSQLNGFVDAWNGLLFAMEFLR
jgi:hypothetical protein